MGDMAPWRLLDGRDQEWRLSLAGVSLAAEIDTDPMESRLALASLGVVYGRNKHSTASERARLLARWPACVVVGMSGVAATDYEEGAYWQKLWGAAEYDGSPTDQRLWGTAFVRALGALRLPCFPGAAQPYLGPILMHSGIPTYCLKDLLRMLADRARKDPGLDADSFIQWATGSPSRMSTLDKPVRHLIEDGGEYAYDIIDRLLGLIDRLREPRPDLFGVGLPQRLVEESCRIKDHGLLGSVSGQRRPAHRGGVGGPRLALDPFGEGPRILLPSASETWRVVVDGQPHHIRTTRGWLGEDATEASFPLAGPARHVQVASLGGEAPIGISVVRDDDPLLTFSEDGEFLPPGRPLPPDTIWVLYPENRELCHEGELHEVSEALLPFGWQGWTLLEVDLTDTTSLRLDAGDTRDVRGTVGPRLGLQEPLQGITAVHRFPVYGVVPLISLPADQPRTWYIEVRALNEQAALKPVRITGRSGDVDPWEHLPRPIIGTFEVDILGPLGFHFHRRITVAEGLSVGYRPDVRLLNNSGLELTTAFLDGQASLSDTLIAFGSDQRERAFTYGGERLLVTPPHISVLHDNLTGGARWSSAPLTLSAESVTQGVAGTLLVRAPASVELPCLQVSGSGISQEIRRRGHIHPGQARYPLSEITDTVAAVRHLDLSLRIRDRIIPVAYIRPRAFASGARRSGNRIQLVDCAAQSGLHAGIYAVFEPWRDAAVLPVCPDATIAIPAHLRDAGPLRVLPAAREASASWPHWPSTSGSLLVQSPLGAQATRSPLSNFVAGSGPCPPSIPNERMWLLVKLAGQLCADGAREDLRAQCDMRLRSYPVPALLDLGKTSLNPAEAVVELIRTGLAGLRMLGSIDVAAARQMWGRLQAVAAMLSGSILADPGQMQDLVDLVAQDHGAAVARMLIGDADPYEPSSVSGRPVSLPEELVAETIELLSATPYRPLTARIQAREDGPARASAALALGMRAGARSGSHRDFRKKYRADWVELARAEPDLVSLDIIAAETAIACIDRRSRGGVT